MTWQARAAAMAETISHRQSRWREAVAATPRHLLVPRWFTWDSDAWRWHLHDGSADQAAWLDAAYSPWETMVTRVGPVHADQADPDDTYPTTPTSSSTLPYLVISMYRHARIYDGADVLDIGTGSGYGCALLAARLGAEHVTSIDVDPYLTDAAARRLDRAGLHPAILTADAAGDLPGSYDRIVPMVSLPTVPASWLAALRPEGRLVFCLAGSSVLITATKTPDGGAAGLVECDGPAFMAARHGPDLLAASDDPPAAMRHAEGEHVSTGRYPVIDPRQGRDLDSMLAVTAPGISYYSCYDQQAGTETVWMTHPDGSWARATGSEDEPALVHQSGPRRLWDMLDDIRHRWITAGTLPLRGADVQIDPDGTCHLSSGSWRATISASRR